MNTTLYLVEGDNAKDVATELSNATGVQDLSGATVVLNLKERKDGVVVYTTPCDVTDAAAGIVTIAGSARTTWVAGTYYAEFVVTYGDSSHDTFPTVAPAAVVIRARAT